MAGADGLARVDAARRAHVANAHRLLAAVPRAELAALDQGLARLRAALEAAERASPQSAP